MKAEFEPGKFSTHYKTELGQKLWKFLIRFDNLVRLETACELSKPAAEAIQRQLCEEFGEELKDNLTIKQMIGLMIKQILKERGYVHDMYNVKIKNSIIFNKASRYIRHTYIPIELSDYLKEH